MTPRTYSIQTLGCRVNQYEAEQLAALLRARGLTPAPADQADLRVVHTCSVTIQAAGKSRQLARRAAGPGPASVELPVLAEPHAEPHAGRPVRHAAEARWTNDGTPSNNDGTPSNVAEAAAGDARRPRVLITGCWATSDSAAARAVPGVDAVITHHDDVAAELDRLLQAWHSGENELGKEDHAGPVRHPAPPSTRRLKTEPLLETGPREQAGTKEQAGLTERAEPSFDRRLATSDDTSDAARHPAKAVPEPSQIDGLNESVGAPAHGPSPLSKSPPGDGVNEKIGARSTPRPAGGNRPPVQPGLRGQAVGFGSLPVLDGRQSGRQRALLKVQDGCDAHCTYCIIPRLRPALWSKPVDAAVEEARRLVDGGHVELVLTGIFLGAYGHATALRRRQRAAGIRMKDDGGTMNGAEGGPPPHSSFIPHPSSLSTLVDALCTRVPGLRRLRLSSLEPGDLGGDLLAALRSHPQVVPHFHLPLQSGSDRLLRRMNRQYTRDDFLRMVEQVRAAFDRPALTTDVIAGFPGESDAEFAQTAEVAEAAGFIHVHAFHFSPRPGTAAARWQRDFVRGPVVNERIAALRTIADRHGLAFRRSFVGQTVELLVEREKEADAGPVGGGAVPAHPTLRQGRCERYFPSGSTTRPPGPATSSASGSRTRPPPARTARALGPPRRTRDAETARRPGRTTKARRARGNTTKHPHKASGGRR